MASQSLRFGCGFGCGILDQYDINMMIALTPSNRCLNEHPCWLLFAKNCSMLPHIHMVISYCHILPVTLFAWMLFLRSFLWVACHITGVLVPSVLSFFPDPAYCSSHSDFWPSVARLVVWHISSPQWLSYISRGLKHVETTNQMRFIKWLLHRIPMFVLVIAKAMVSGIFALKTPTDVSCCCIRVHPHDPQVLSNIFTARVTCFCCLWRLWPTVLVSACCVLGTTRTLGMFAESTMCPKDQRKHGWWFNGFPFFQATIRVGKNLSGWSLKMVEDLKMTLMTNGP